MLNHVIYEKMFAQCLVVFVISCLTNVIAKDDVHFDKWLDEHGISADSVDYETWKANLEYVEMHNRGGHSFTVIMNKFAHLTPKQLVKATNLFVHDNDNDKYFVSSGPLPDSVDWRENGVVTPVWSQSQEDSAIPFSASDVLASHFAIETGKLIEASREELVECCHYEPCHSVSAEDPFTCVHHIGGICSEESYRPGNTCVCHNNTCTQIGTVNGSCVIPRGNETALQAAVAKQPVMVMVDAGHKSFQLYQSGTYYEPDCSSTILDHSMLVVGYGEFSTGEEYWIVKNSWSTLWGDLGYMLMARNRNNNCGIATMAEYPC
ncbi:procathepsin L-like [Dysidea avara]|uniref:procathepsin L-like n=1 Tax=Dysidea avara TaxID=196820 RepID=UPI003326B6B9